MIREAGPGDRARVEALLTARIDGAMFPLANLRNHGIGTAGFASGHPYASRYWLLGQDGVVAVSQAGVVMPVLGAGSDLSALRSAFGGLTLTGVIGPSLSARPVLSALGLDTVPMQLDADQPGFSLALADLRLPSNTGSSLRPLTHALRRLAEDWRTAAKVETEGLTEAEARARAATDIDGWIAADSHRILFHDGQPVAMTGFNARLPEIVQVGGVYTPPGLRGRGHARTAVALHLAEARAGGVSRAVLFAATPAAARAYLALGFQPAADFTLALFRQPVTLPP